MQWYLFLKIPLHLKNGYQELIHFALAMVLSSEGKAIIKNDYEKKGGRPTIYVKSTRICTEFCSMSFEAI